MITGTCWTLAVMVALFLAGIFICRAISVRRRPPRLPEEERVEKVADEIASQTTQLKAGLRRISDAPDPLEAFIDAICGKSAERTDRRHNREQS